MKISDANTQICGYDKLYQLTAVDYNDGNSADYDYDKLGNRRTVVNGETTAYTSNTINQYETVAGTNYTYDKNGNLTYDGQYTYIYDCENRLLEVKQGETTIVSYAYDYRGRRVARTAGTTAIAYLYDGDQVVAEYNASGNWQRRYYYGPGIDEPICMMRLSPAFVYYYHFDGLGSVAALSFNSAVVVEKYSYDAYGQPTIKSSTGAIRTTSAYSNPYMFTGRKYDPNVGLYYYRARFYSPNLGRFLQTDPIGYYDSMNLYQYCLNNPGNWIDPWGLLSQGGVLNPVDKVTYSVVSDNVKDALNKRLNPGKDGPGKNLKPSDTARAGNMIADEMTNKELDRIKKITDDTQKIAELDKIKKRIEDKLKGGKGDPETEKDRDKNDPGYKPKKGDQEIVDRLNEAIKSCPKEGDK